MTSIAFMPITSSAEQRQARILAAAIANSGLKKKAIAEAARASPAELYQWETGRRPVPPERAAALARALDIDNPADISQGYAEIASSRPRAAMTSDEHPEAEQLALLQAEVHALTLALGAITAAMVAHRPTEAQDVAAALRRNVPARHREGGLIQELLRVLDKKR